MAADGEHMLRVARAHVGHGLLGRLALARLAQAVVDRHDQPGDEGEERGGGPADQGPVAPCKLA